MTDFPTDALPRTLADFVDEAAESFAKDKASLTLPALAGLAGAVGNTHAVRVKQDWVEPAVLWLVVVAESGQMKSDTSRAALSPILHADRTLRETRHGKLEQFRQDFDEYKTLKKQWKPGKPKPAEPDRPPRERFIVQDTTIEALSSVLNDNPRGLLLYRDELSGWFRGMNQYRGGKGGDEAHYLSMYDAAPVAFDRVADDRTIFVPRAAVSIFGTCQPEIMQTLLAGENQYNGMAARWLMAMPEKRRFTWTESHVTESVEHFYHLLYQRLLSVRFDAGDTPTLVGLSPDAKRLFVPFCERIGEEQYYLQGVPAARLAKLRGTTARIALVLHLATWAEGVEDTPPTAISQDTMEQAIHVAEWFKREWESIDGRMVAAKGDRQEVAILEFIWDENCRPISARDLQRKRLVADAAEGDVVLRRLADEGLGELETRQNERGTPSIKFVPINHEIFTRMA